jgi:hypothetical protein
VRGRRSLLIAIMALSMVGVVACDRLPSLPFPFGPKPAESQPTPSPATAPKPTAVPSPDAAAPSKPAFTPFWVRNHQITEMWSGPPGQQGVISFGTTSQRFCAFQVVQPQDSSRLYVLNPYSSNYFWIDEAAIGPVDPPERRAAPKPADQNCADVIYEG